MSKAEAEAGVLFQATVLSASLPTAVTLSLCPDNGTAADHVMSRVACTQHPMVAIADQRTGRTHSQVYQVTTATPTVGFAFSISATIAAAQILRSPIEGSTTVTVI